MKQVRYLLEAIGVYIAFFIFSILSIQTASSLGGYIARNIGPRLAASRKALKHLKHALPHKSEQEYNIILKDMWDNLGRVFAEYPHLKNIGKNHVEIEGEENLNQITSEQPAVFISAHICNWEVGAASLYIQKNILLDLIYRAPNNPYVHKILDQCRTLNGQIKTIPKSRIGMKEVMDCMKENRNIGILVDQKYNEGIPIPFFGYTAMTSPAFVQLAQKFDCPLILILGHRLQGTHFVMKIHPPIVTKNRNTEDVIQEVHSILEKWIETYPGQWLWLHRRWNACVFEEQE